MDSVLCLPPSLLPVPHEPLLLLSPHFCWHERPPTEEQALNTQADVYAKEKLTAMAAAGPGCPPEGFTGDM